MADIFDYLYWRDDLTLEQAPFNEVDAVILTRLSYLPFEHLAPQMVQSAVSIRDAAVALLLEPDMEKKVLMKEDFKLLSYLSRGKRFGEMQMFAYENRVEEETQTQFSAMTVRLGENCHYVLYRGTDNTLVGWKENFNMAFVCPVPAQTLAVDYLQRVAALTEGMLIVGGHSKGGNLAVYASAYCTGEVQQRISHIYNFDGPGFDDMVLSTEGYQNVFRRVSTYVPQSSVVGMLLGHEEEYTIVHSTQSINILQHDIYTWEVERNNFQYVQTVTDGSKLIDATVKSWVGALDCAKREKFIDAIYSVLTKTNAETIRQMRENWFESAVNMAKAIRDLDDDTRALVMETLRALMYATKTELEEVLRARPGLNSPPKE